MKKLLYLSFGLVLAMGVGCALVEYPVIIDNDQVNQGGQYIVNTNGKAHVMETQVATIWPDGYDEIIWFVDQDASGNQHLTNYNNYSTAYPIFHDDLYCNPDWVGCSVWTNYVPVELNGQFVAYQYNSKWNPNCAGYRSLSVLLGTTRYYGECGRRMPLSDVVTMMNLGQVDGQNMKYFFRPDNTTLRVDNNAGYVATLGLNSEIPMVLNRSNRTGIINMTDPLTGRTLENLAQIAREHGTNKMTLTVNFYNVERSFTVAFMPDKMSSFVKANF